MVVEPYDDDRPYFLLIEREWDRILVKQVDVKTEDEKDAPVLYELLIGSGTEVVLTTADAAHSMAVDGKLRIVV